MKTINYRLQQKLEEVFFLEPNELGVSYLTSLYKKTTSYLKSLPFIVIIPLSLMAAVFIYLLLGRLIIKLVTLLQYGF